MIIFLVQLGKIGRLLAADSTWARSANIFHTHVLVMYVRYVRMISAYYKIDVLPSPRQTVNQKTTPRCCVPPFSVMLLPAALTIGVRVAAGLLVIFAAVSASIRMSTRQPQHSNDHAPKTERELPTSSNESLRPIWRPMTLSPKSIRRANLDRRPILHRPPTTPRQRPLVTKQGRRESKVARRIRSHIKARRRVRYVAGELVREVRFELRGLGDQVEERSGVVFGEGEVGGADYVDDAVGYGWTLCAVAALLAGRVEFVVGVWDVADVTSGDYLAATCGRGVVSASMEVSCLCEVLAVCVCKCKECEQSWEVFRECHLELGRD